MTLLVLACACAAVYVVFRHRDRRMLRNGVMLFAALFFAILGIVDIAARRSPVVEVLLVGVVLLLPIALLVLAGFLFANGFRMFRREGRSLGNTLSFIAGLAIVVLMATTLVVLRLNSTVAGTVFLLALGIAGYFGIIFVVFLLYAIVYGRIRFPPAVDVVVVLGSGLVGGRVPPLLRSRLDKAIDVYRRSVEAGRTPLMIPTGGQGADESRPEGAAMAEYLLEQGIPSDHVRAELVSRNTRENLVLSRLLQDRAGATGTVLVVTNNYHVLRTAMLARSIGSDAQVVGAPTARYYVPSAFLREYLAVVAAHRIGHTIVLAVFALLWSLVLVGTLVQGR